MTAPVDVWAADGYELAEGPRRVGDRVVFVDILTGRLLEAPPDGPGPARVLAQLDIPLGAVAPVAGEADEWIAAAGTGIGLISGRGEFTWIDRPEDANPVATRMNDGVADEHGRFWAGSMAYDTTPGAGSLYRVDPDGTVTRVLDGLTIANGPAFAEGGATMYLADTPTGRIHRYRVDATGSLTDGAVFAEVPKSAGSPDGLTVDDQGRLWVALWGGSRVHCYDPDGTVARVVPVPARQPSSVCLGSPGDDRLFVTTAAHGLDDPTRADGALLCVRIPASAPPAHAWRGTRTSGSERPDRRRGCLD